MGDADKAAALATELILNDHVGSLIGPIGRKEVAAVAKVARFFGVPEIALASDVPPTTTDEPDPVLRVRTSPSELAAAVARHAKNELGLQRFAMLVPDNDPGREAADGFRQELERLGVAVVREIPFDPTAKDLGGPVKALVALADLPPKKRKPSRVKPDFDALFVPADAMVVRKLAPLLAYWGVAPRVVPGGTGVQLLGGSAWNHPAVIDKGEHLTTNAIFADVFVADGDDGSSDFERRFLARMNRRPGAFHAECWDAARVAIDTLLGAPSDRLALRDRFLQPRALTGATGELVLRPFGRGVRFEPRVRLLTIEGDAIRPRLPERDEKARLPPAVRDPVQ